MKLRQQRSRQRPPRPANQQQRARFWQHGQRPAQASPHLAVGLF
jgi:hypothetical protein